MVGCMGRISHKNLKIHIVISEIATSKNHIERLVPVRSETGFVILGKFWSKNDLRQHRNWKFWVDYQGCLRKRTDSDSIYQSRIIDFHMDFQRLKNAGADTFQQPAG
jgi:hypothetical protein